MTLMSRKIDYALLILSYLDRKKERACAREIADRYALNPGFVANILKELCSRGFVSSQRGAKGGYVLARPAEAISLAELMERLDEGFHLAECNKQPTRDTCTLATVCPVRGAIAEVHRRIREVLRDVTLAQIFRPQGATAEAGRTLGLAVIPWPEGNLARLAGE